MKKRKRLFAYPGADRSVRIVLCGSFFADRSVHLRTLDDAAGPVALSKVPFDGLRDPLLEIPDRFPAEDGPGA